MTCQSVIIVLITLQNQSAPSQMTILVPQVYVFSTSHAARAPDGGKWETERQRERCHSWLHLITKCAIFDHVCLQRHEPQDGCSRPAVIVMFYCTSKLGCAIPDDKAQDEIRSAWDSHNCSIIPIPTSKTFADPHIVHYGLRFAVHVVGALEYGLCNSLAGLGFDITRVKINYHVLRS
jgi:hypothetical protein